MDVLADWGLASSQVERVAGGATNETWRVTDGNAVGFLRKYRTPDLVAVQREHHIIEVVADRGVLTPRPMQSTDGNRIVESGGSLVGLTDRQSGRLGVGRQHLPCKLGSDELDPVSKRAGGRTLLVLRTLRALSAVVVVGFVLAGCTADDADREAADRPDSERIVVADGLLSRCIDVEPSEQEPPTRMSIEPVAQPGDEITARWDFDDPEELLRSDLVVDC